MGTVIEWTDEEKKILKAVYPRGGILAAMEALPHRPRQGISKMCSRLDLGSRGPYFRGGNQITPEPNPAIAGAFNKWRADYRGQIFARPY